MYVNDANLNKSKRKMDNFEEGNCGCGAGFEENNNWPIWRWW